jgi:hypothetical protein
MFKVLSLAPLGLVFVGGQLYLARLTAGTATSFAIIVLLGFCAFGVGWLAFLRNAKVSVASDEVIVFNWLGRVSLKAPRAQLHLDLVSVHYWGRYRDGAILANPDGNDAVVLWRETWGANPIRNLSRQFHDVKGHSHRLLSARMFRNQYPQVRLENFPAIGLAILVVLAVVLALSGH